MIGGRIRSRGGHHDGVLHGAGLFELGDDAGDVRLLLTDGDVDVVDRTEVLGAGILLIDAGLIDHRVHADRGLAGRTVTDDQFALTTADGNHRVDGHDAGLERLAHRFALHNARGDFLDRIESSGLDGSLAVQGAAQNVNDAAQQTFADGHRQQLAGGLHLAALMETGVVTHDDGTDLGLFEVQGEADDAIAKVEHLVGHAVGKAFDLADTVGDFTDLANVLARHRSLGTSDLGLNFLEQGTHVVCGIIRLWESWK